MSKRRDLPGLSALTGVSTDGIKMFFYIVLGWFTVTVEVFMRKDFGERYLTKGNFYIGFVLLSVVTFLTIFISSQSFSWAMGLLWKLYLWFSAYHFWKMWVDNQTGSPNHSLYMGKSHLNGLGRRLKSFLNPIITSLARVLGKITLSAKQSELLNQSLELSSPIKDLDAFTKKWVEPGFLLFFSFLFFKLDQNMLGVWLLICFLAMLVHTHMSFAFQYEEQLDISDSIIEAAYQKEDIESQKEFRNRMREALAAVEQRMVEEPEYLEEIIEENPSIAEALAELSPNLQDLGNQRAV